MRNYRSIGDEHSLDLAPGLTIVGPNNSGKSNVLGAIRLLFSGYENAAGYRRDRDLTFGKSREQTTLVAVFDADPERDIEVLEKYGRLLALYEPPRVPDGTAITLQLIFSTTGNPTYRLSSDTTTRLPRDQQGTHSRLLHELVDTIVAGARVHYVPSSNSSEQLFSELVSPLVKQAVATKLEAEIAALGAAVENVSLELTESVRAAGLPELSIDLGLPRSADGGFLSHFDLSLADPTRTAAIDKGRGIQALAMLACFAWIAKQESEAGLQSIWLVEEPESFLHPLLYPIAQNLLAAIENSGQVVRTTHALTMVPRDRAAIVGTSLDEAGRTRLSRYQSVENAAEHLRGSLGVRFSDFFALGQHNVFVEGQSDIDFLRWALDGPFADSGFSLLRSAIMRQFGGTRGLEGFLRSNYPHIRPETCVVSLFDGDEAGLKAIRDLTGYLTNQGTGFNSNVDYVVGRSGHAIEGLFGDTLLLQMRESNGAWFEHCSSDASGRLLTYKIRDQSKAASATWLMDNATRENESSWRPEWTATLEALESALTTWRPGRK